MKGFMSVNNGLPRNDDRARYIEIKTSNDQDIDQFDEDGGMIYATYFLGKFNGVALDGNGHVALSMPLDNVTHWRYYD